MQRAHQPPAVGGLAVAAWAERGVDDGPGAAGGQRGQTDLRVAGGGVLVGALAQAVAGAGVVGHVQAGAVDRAHEHPAPAGSTGQRAGGRAAQQIEQRPQRTGTQPGAGVPQSGGRDLRDRQAIQRAGQLAPYGRIPGVLEQAGRQQQVDHDPGGQLADSALHPAGVSEGLVNHLERHDPGQLTQMTWREHTLRYRDLSTDDTLSRQRSSPGRTGSSWSTDRSTGAPLPTSGDPPDHPHTPCDQPRRLNFTALP